MFKLNKNKKKKLHSLLSAVLVAVMFFNITAPVVMAVGETPEQSAVPTTPTGLTTTNITQDSATLSWDAVPPTTMDFVQVSAGKEHSVALAEDGSVWTWGSNDYGELGLGHNNDVLVPTQVTSLGYDNVQVDAGGEFTLVLKENGSVWSFGSNGWGQLGNGTNTDSNVPVQVQGLTSGVTDISAGNFHSLAIQNGSVKAWGDNSAGQLGNGTNTDSNVPVQVQGLTSGVTDISAGGSHSLAIQNSSVWSFGSNGSGQLGNGTNTSSNVPVQGLTSGVIDISAGNNHCLAIQNGSVKAWGENSFGGLGNGTNTDSNVPVTSVFPLLPISYDVYVGDTLVDTTTSTSYTFSGLPTGTTSTLGVVAKNANGSSTKATIDVVTTPANTTGLTSTVTDTTATLTWSSVEGATSYDVYLNGSLVENTTSTSYTFSDLEEGTSYELGVEAKNASGSSGYSTITATTTLPSPTGMNATDVGQTTATLTWSSVEGATSYDVYLNGSLVENTTSTSYTFSDLEEATTYTLGVVAKTNDTASTQATIDISTVPTNPMELTTSNITQNRATLTWTSVEGATSYDVYLDGEKIDNTTETFYVYEELESSTTYEVGVSAISADGDASEIVTEEITTATPPTSESENDDNTDETSDNNLSEVSDNGSNDGQSDVLEVGNGIAVMNPDTDDDSARLIIGLLLLGATTFCIIHYRRKNKKSDE